MARVLSSITVDQPTDAITPAVDDTFTFEGTPGFTGSGGVTRYDFKWEVDAGAGYVTIASSGTGLTTADTNPLVNSNSASANSITVTVAEAGTYTIRMVGAPATGGSYTVISATRSVTVSAPDVIVTPTPVSSVAVALIGAVVLGALTLIPNAGTAVPSRVDPVVVLGSISTVPASGSAAAATVDPTVILGSISAVQSPVSAVAATVDPVIPGEGVTVIPSPASVWIKADDCRRMYQGGTKVLWPPDESQGSL